MAFTYEAANYDITWFGVDLSTGWGTDTFLTITPNASRVSYVAGADGNLTFSKNADKSATITMNFTQAAQDTLKEIYAIYAAQDLIGSDVELAPFIVRDRSESGLESITFVCTNAVLTEVPENTYANESTERTFTWVCEKYILGEDVSTITGQLADYIK